MADSFSPNDQMKFVEDEEQEIVDAFFCNNYNIDKPNDVKKNNATNEQNVAVGARHAELRAGVFAR